MTEVPMSESADDYARREREYREEGYRHSALAQAVSIMAGVARSGRTVPVVKTLELADHFAAYLRDGTVPERVAADPFGAVE